MTAWRTTNKVANGISIDVQNIARYNVSQGRAVIMLAVNYSQFRDKMKAHMGMVTIITQRKTEGLK